MSETVAMTLTEFLLARIAEDEAAARAGTEGPWSFSDVNDPHLWTGDDPGDGIAHASWETGDRSSADFAHIARHDPARVLAECEAKRRIVEASTSAAARRARSVTGLPVSTPTRPNMHPRNGTRVRRMD